MALKFAIASKAKTAHDPHDGGRVGAQALGHRAHAKQYVFARVLKNRADDFLPLDAKLLDAFAQVRRRSWGRTILAFHQARGLLKSHAVSTIAGCGNKVSRLNLSTIISWLQRP